MGKKHSQKVAQGVRFRFGDNWKSFLKVLKDKHIQKAECSLKKMLDVDNLQGKRFLDIGSGSGLFSLAASRLGATVFSFDYDPQSVACTRELKNRYHDNNNDWVIEEGSVLDANYLATLGKFDVVYSWGVLHHTGNMWNALINIDKLIKEEQGKLFIAIYNDQDIESRFWLFVKKKFNINLFFKILIKIIFYPVFTFKALLVGLVRYHNIFGKFIEYKNNRGMSIVHDWNDWLGGYPFEVAKPEEIIFFFLKKKFNLKKLKTTNRLGCNEYVFEKRG